MPVGSVLPAPLGQSRNPWRNASIKGALEKWFTGDTKANTVFDGISTLGESMNSARANMEGLSTGTFESDIDAMDRTVHQIVEILKWISSDDVTVDDTSGVSSGYVPTFTNVIDQIAQLGGAISGFNGNTKGIDTARLDTITQSTQAIAQALSSMALLTETDGVSAFEGALDKLRELLSGEGEEPLDVTGWLSGLDGDKVAATLSTFTEQVGTAVSGSTAALTGYGESFNAVGGSLAASLSAGLSGSGGEAASGASKACGAMLDAVKRHESQFNNAGYNLGLGLRNGLNRSKSLLTAAATAVAKAMVQAAKDALGIASPSKEFAKIGMYADQGLAKGLTTYSRVVTHSAETVGKGALDTARGTLSKLSAMLGQDVDADPVIRPVVDLSNVAKGAKAIDGMLPGSRTLSLSDGTSRALAHKVSAEKSMRNSNQNGSKNVNYDHSNSGNVTVNVDKLNTQSEEDVRTLALELSRYNRRMQFGYGGT